ncbi:MAG TPA: anaerobic ribonucleoside-triphosphate reductase activating protein [Chlamydiales bacterium]|nr:anaerobic ribonucleoside-triphosphate reductase activating protein [Chlamydiales bacterium]
MRVGGLLKLSLIDYPQKLSCVIFTQGCPFRCHFCHNPSLVLPEKFTPVIEEEEIFNFLQKRVGQLDAVVISGGEPTIQKDLITFAKKIRQLGYFIKLDTSGIRPDVIQKLLDEKLVDYIAMDIKTSSLKYESIINVNIDLNAIKTSIELIKNSSIDYEFRTTILPDHHQEEEVHQMGELIKGAKLHILQGFIPDFSLNPDFQSLEKCSEIKLKECQKIAEKYVDKCEIRIN